MVTSKSNFLLWIIGLPWEQDAIKHLREDFPSMMVNVNRDQVDQGWLLNSQRQENSLVRLADMSQREGMETRVDATRQWNLGSHVINQDVLPSCHRSD